MYGSLNITICWNEIVMGINNQTFIQINVMLAQSSAFQGIESIHIVIATEEI